MTRQGTSSSNYFLLLISGILGSMAGLLASPSLVLPFLYLALGAPQVIAALLLPSVTAARLVSEFMIAPSLSRFDTAKLATVFPNLATAGILAVVALFAGGLEPWMVATLFLFAALVMGISEGVLELGLSQVYGLAVDNKNRSQMAYMQIGVGCLIAIAVTWLTHDLLIGDTPYQRHIVVLWIGISALILAAIATARLTLARTSRHTTPPQGPTIRERLRMGIQQGAQTDWYRRYVAGRVFFLSIELAMPFYTIHAATIHVTTYHSLSVFVISASAGTAVGAALWRVISRRSLKNCIMYGAIVSATGATLILGFHGLGMTIHPWSYAISIFLLSIGIGGVGTGRYLYVIKMSSDDDRTNLIALSDVIVGTLGIAFAAVLGMAAHLANESVPLMVLVVLNICAAYMAYRLIEPEDAPQSA